MTTCWSVFVTVGVIYSRAVTGGAHSLTKQEPPTSLFEMPILFPYLTLYFENKQSHRIYDVFLSNVSQQLAGTAFSTRTQFMNSIHTGGPLASGNKPSHTNNNKWLFINRNMFVRLHLQLVPKV